jgi:hypothetical protein
MNKTIKATLRGLHVAYSYVYILTNNSNTADEPSVNTLLMVLSFTQQRAFGLHVKLRSELLISFEINV